MKQLTDEELVSAYISTSETQHFTLLYERYYQKVYAHCVGFAGKNAQAEDLAHDVFERVLQKIDTFTGHSRFATWLYAVCRNYCLTEYQQQQRRDRAMTDYYQTTDWSVLPDTTQPLEQQLSLLEIALGKLPDNDRQLVAARYETGHSINQLAESTHASPSAVKMRLWRVRGQLRQAINQPVC